MELGSLFTALLYVALVALGLYILFYFLGKMSLPEPVRLIILAIVVIILLLWFVRNVLPSLGISF